MQVGCRGQGKRLSWSLFSRFKILLIWPISLESCGNSTDFGNLKFIGNIGIGNGYILNGDEMSTAWAYGLYARGILAIAVHYFTILNIFAQCIWIGFFTNLKIERKMEVIKERPDEDIVSIFTTFKQR